MGGKLIPRIGSKARSVAGFVVLAGSTQPLEAILEYQIPYLAAVDGKISPREKKEIERTRKQAARLRARDYKDDTPARELLGMPPSRWREWHGYDPPRAALKLRRPMLILQGERDYQVTMKDFAGWKKALAGKRWVTFRSFPKLNHLFIAGEGKSTPGEYGMPGNVSLEVIETIERWIKARVAPAG
jgi:fermentation-respiration switch protein FrsA (DUF1100 family)